MGIFRFIGGMTVGIALAPFTGGGSLVAAGVATGLITEFIGSEEDESRERKAIEQGYKNGYKKGVIETAKKFAEELERNDNFRFAAFALGFHISKLAGNPFDKVSVIVGALGNPNSKLLKPHVRSENKKIIDGNLSFNQIEEKYLKNLSLKDLKLIDEFLEDVVNEGDYISACHQFYNNDWKKYLKDSDGSNLSPEEAQELYRQAHRYFYGDVGYEIDKEKAICLLTKSANAGNYFAKDFLSNIK